MAIIPHVIAIGKQYGEAGPPILLPRYPEKAAPIVGPVMHIKEYEKDFLSFLLHFDDHVV